MPKPRVNHSRKIPSAHPTVSLALLVQVGAVPGPPGACSIIGHHPGSPGSDHECEDFVSPCDSAAGPRSNSMLIWSSAFTRTGLHSRNCIASMEPEDDSLNVDV